MSRPNPSISLKAVIAVVPALLAGGCFDRHEARHASIKDSAQVAGYYAERAPAAAPRAIQPTAKPARVATQTPVPRVSEAKAAPIKAAAPPSLPKADAPRVTEITRTPPPITPPQSVERVEPPAGPNPVEIKPPVVAVPLPPKPTSPPVIAIAPPPVTPAPKMEASKVEPPKSAPAIVTPAPVQTPAPAAQPVTPATPLSPLRDARRDTERPATPAPATAPAPKVEAPKAVTPPVVVPPAPPVKGDAPKVEAPKVTPPAQKQAALPDPPAAAPKLEATGPAIAPKRASELIEKADLLLRVGNVAGARETLVEAVRGRSVDALVKMGETYDPVELKKHPVASNAADAAKATEFYLQAIAQGSAPAKTKLDAMRRAQLPKN